MGNWKQTAAILLGLGCAATPPMAQTKLSADLLRREAGEIERAAPTSEALQGYSTSPQRGLTDPRLPAVELRALRDTLSSASRYASGTVRRPLLDAAQGMDDAWTAYAMGSPDLSHLSETVRRIAAVQRALSVVADREPAMARWTELLQSRLSETAHRIAADLTRAATRAGLSRDAMKQARSLQAIGTLAGLEGDYERESGMVAEGIGQTGGSIVFDPALFEERVASQLDGAAIGYTMAWRLGNVGNGISNGRARTEADMPELEHVVTKQSHVSSVSKTITAITILRMLGAEGASPYDSVAQWLPSGWDPAPPYDTMTFAEFMQHRSGFGQLGVADGYAAIRDAVNGGASTTSSLYMNSNYGIMRILAAGLSGLDLSTAPIPVGENVAAAAAFVNALDATFSPIGVQADCVSNDPTPMIHYLFPYAGDPGYEVPDRRLVCGGIGVFISAQEMAQIMSRLLTSEDLLSAAMRTTMMTDFLGFNDPVDWAFAAGAFGTYHMHGGDWFVTGEGEVHTCIAGFPNGLSVGLIVNSNLVGAPYQCIVLRNAFDASWVPG